MDLPAPVDIREGSRCHCPCHRGRSPRLTDRTESAFACDQCAAVHYEAAAVERAGFDGARGPSSRMTRGLAALAGFGR